MPRATLARVTATPCDDGCMARTWLAIRVELVGGRSEDFWPRPGRLFAAARGHSFAQLAAAIDTAFSRWDLAHLHEFALADGSRIGMPDSDEPDDVLDDRKTKLSRLALGEQFAYVFDFGDDWAHLCTVEEEKIDPLDELGDIPPQPTPFWGWGSIPDQYGRRRADDDGESETGDDPGLEALPPLLPWWGPRRH